jgi:hypothetical protein
VLRKWIEESYRAVAPKTLVATLDATRARPVSRPIRYKKKKRA